MRMLAGIMAAQSFACQMTGDDSLRKRPMARIVAPLRKMGAQISSSDGGRPPLLIYGQPLRAIDYMLPVASAQVKSCVSVRRDCWRKAQPVSKSRCERAITANWRCEPSALRSSVRATAFRSRAASSCVRSMLRFRAIFLPRLFFSALPRFSADRTWLSITCCSIPHGRRSWTFSRSSVSKFVSCSVAERNGEVVGSVQVRGGKAARSGRTRRYQRIADRRIAGAGRDCALLGIGRGHS